MHEVYLTYYVRKSDGTILGFGAVHQTKQSAVESCDRYNTTSGINDFYQLHNIAIAEV